MKDSSQKIIQCPNCQTKFAVDGTLLAGVDFPRFHCSRCDFVFSIEKNGAPVAGAQGSFAVNGPTIKIEQESPSTHFEPENFEPPSFGEAVSPGTASREAPAHTRGNRRESKTTNDTSHVEVAPVLASIPVAFEQNDNPVVNFAESTSAQIQDFWETSPAPIISRGTTESRVETFAPIVEVLPPTSAVSPNSAPEVPTLVNEVSGQGNWEADTPVIHRMAQCKESQGTPPIETLSALSTSPHADFSASAYDPAFESDAGAPGSFSLYKLNETSAEKAAAAAEPFTYEVPVTETFENPIPQEPKAEVAGVESELDDTQDALQTQESAVDPVQMSLGLPIAESNEGMPQALDNDDVRPSSATSKMMRETGDLSTATFPSLRSLRGSDGPSTPTQERLVSSAANPWTTSTRQYSANSRWHGMTVLLAPCLCFFVFLVCVAYFSRSSSDLTVLVSNILLPHARHPAPAGLVIKSSSLRSVTLDSGDKIPIIAGEIINGSSKPIKEIRLEALLFDNAGAVMGSPIDVRAVPTLARARVRSLSVDMIRAIQDSPERALGELKTGDRGEFGIALLDQDLRKASSYSVRVHSVQE